MSASLFTSRGDKARVIEFFKKRKGLVDTICIELQAEHPDYSQVRDILQKDFENYLDELLGILSVLPMKHSAEKYERRREKRHGILR